MRRPRLLRRSLYDQVTAAGGKYGLFVYLIRYAGEREWIYTWWQTDSTVYVIQRSERCFPVSVLVVHSQTFLWKRLFSCGFFIPVIESEQYLPEQSYKYGYKNGDYKSYTAYGEIGA